MNSFSRLRTIALILALAAIMSVGVSAQFSLSTGFAGNTGSGGNMFDVVSPTGIIITGMDVHFTGTAVDIEVWSLTGGGSFLGNESNMAAWTLQGTATGLTNSSIGTATPLGIPLSIPLLPGQTQGLYVTTAPSGGGGTMWYDSGVTQGALAISDANLEIYVGNGGGYFSNTIVGRGWNGTIYYQLASSNADDLFLSSIDAPNDSMGCSSLTSTETVQATFINVGSNTLLNGTLIQYDLVVDGGATITEFELLPNDLTTGASYQYTFMATADLSAIGSHTIDVTATFTGDMDPSNDSQSKTVNSGAVTAISAFPWTENFDSAPSNQTTIPPAGWTQDTTDATGTDSDWYFRNTQTSSTNTGPVGGADATSGSGYFAYVEDSSGNHPQVNLITPCIDLGALTSPQLLFEMHSYNNTTPTTTNENFLSVDVITYPGAVTTTDVFGPAGHDAMNTSYATSQWRTQVVDLTPYAGQVIQLVFRGRSDGGSFTHDIAIDDVAVFEPQPTPGQPSQLGTAVMDINNAVNGNLLPVSSGAGGPYFTTVTQGGQMAMHFEGQPIQPISVLYGALNPASATYPAIGQFDIGGPGVDAAGIPLNIGVYVDGIAWATNGFIGFPVDALFFTDLAGNCDVTLTMPDFGLPAGTNLTTMQAALTVSGTPFFAIANAVDITLN